MKQYYILLFLLSQVYSAPAIVTVWQTITSTIPDPASPTINSQATSQIAAAAAVAPVVTSPVAAVQAVTTTQAVPTATATAGFWGNLLNNLFDSSGSSTSSSSSSSSGDSSVGTTTPSSSSSGSSLSSLLRGLFGGDSSSSSSSSSVVPIANTPATLAVAAVKAYLVSAPVASVQTSSVVVSQPSTSSTPVASPSTSSTSSSTSSSNGDIYAAISQCNGIDNSFASEILDQHNKYRSLHKVGQLSWDVDTYNYAKNNADNYDCSGILTHTHGQFGENLAAGYKNGPATVDAWVDEPILYSASNFIYNHFTQVIWKGLTKVGCAYKDCTSSGWGLYVVCEYDPYGNVIGEGPQNVFP